MSETGDITIRELVTKLYDATQKMRRTNSHRALMLQAMSALMQLSTRLDAQEERQAEAAAAKETPRVQLVEFIQ